MDTLYNILKYLCILISFAISLQEIYKDKQAPKKDISKQGSSSLRLRLWLIIISFAFATAIQAIQSRNQQLHTQKMLTAINKELNILDWNQLNFELNISFNMNDSIFSKYNHRVNEVLDSLMKRWHEYPMSFGIDTNTVIFPKEDLSPSVYNFLHALSIKFKFFKKDTIITKNAILQFTTTGSSPGEGVYRYYTDSNSTTNYLVLHISHIYPNFGGFDASNKGELLTLSDLANAIVEFQIGVQYYPLLRGQTVLDAPAWQKLPFSDYTLYNLTININHRKYSFKNPYRMSANSSNYLVEFPSNVMGSIFNISNNLKVTIDDKLKDSD